MISVKLTTIFTQLKKYTNQLYTVIELGNYDESE